MKRLTRDRINRLRKLRKEQERTKKKIDKIISQEQLDKFPHICPFCGNPAYIGFLGTLECRDNCKNSKKKKDFWYLLDK